MSSPTTRPELFVLGSGQNDNIGDVVLRREYFDRLRRIGRLHVYMGSASTEFIESLRFSESDQVYAGLREWHSAAWRAWRHGRIWFVDKPGELALDKGVLRLELKLLPLVLGARVRSGQVLRLGMAARSIDPHYLRYLRPLLGLSTIVRWRDTSSGQAFGFGAVSPDWAFGWEKTDLDSLRDPRDVIAVTYRGDRDPPSETVLALLSQAAHERAWRLVVVSQVRRDAALSADLAARLGADLVPWPTERTLAEQEEIVRAVYRASALVVSDRLHALIVGMTEGAAPLCLTQTGERKIERHLDAAGFPGSTVCINDIAHQPLSAVLECQIGRREEAVSATRSALSILDDLTEQLTELA